ncbi:MAG: glycosyltransferase [Chloroflexota bacterium]
MRQDFAGACRSPFLAQYLTRVLECAPPGSRTLEIGSGTAFGAVWLSLRGVLAEGVDVDPTLVGRAREANGLLGGSARYWLGGLWDLGSSERPNRADRYAVIHHQGQLEHFDSLRVRAILERQVAAADRVVFSVPSVYYPFEPESGDERLLPLEEWGRLVEGFDVAELTYYGDPQLGAREHILCVLKGDPAAGTPRRGGARKRSQATARTAVGPASDGPVDSGPSITGSVPAVEYPFGISAIVHTRNEERNLDACLASLQGWTDEIIVCDMESTDRTVEIARGYTDQIVSHPLMPNFDRARNVSAMRARYRWIFYLDADERAPRGLGAMIRDLTTNHGDTFEAALPPFRHFFSGKHLTSLYPGYTSPRLFKNGCFRFNARLHGGAVVDGRTVRLPADDPELAIVHYSYESVEHYLGKMNAYTTGEAENAYRDGSPFHWRGAVRHMVEDLRSYYDFGGAHRDGVHGFIYTWLSGFYRLLQHAKLYERRYRSGELRPEENEVPESVEQMLEFALQVVRERPPARPPEIAVDPGAGSAQVVWSGPHEDPSGYGEESRNFLFALDDAGASVAAHPLVWSRDPAGLGDAEARRLAVLLSRPAAPGFVHVVQDFPPSYARHPQAAVSIGRTMFETDRIPQDWVRACNRMDHIWVPTEFNRRTFTQAGVAAEKLAVVPGCFDPTAYVCDPESARVLRARLLDGAAAEPRFVFLSVFDWTLHKGWDVLLRSFLQAFEGREDVTLLLKVWSTMPPGVAGMRSQAEEFVRRELDHDLSADPRVRFVEERLTRRELVALYHAADAYVLPSRGEGWGRPFMEAMACGKPAIGTNWSGNTAFMTSETSYLVDCAVRPVPEAGWREIPTYRGHRWAEPDGEHLKHLLVQVVEDRAGASEIGRRGMEYVVGQYSRERVGKLVCAEVERALETLRPHPPSAPKVGRRPANVVLEGELFQWHSLAHVNRELAIALMETGEVNLSLSPIDPPAFEPQDYPRFAGLPERVFAPHPGPIDVRIRHRFPPRLDQVEEGRLVLIQPWEYGYLPEAWIQPIRDNVDEVWCYSNYVRDVYARSGIAEDRTHVVRLGVDADVFSPDAPPYVFTTEAGAARYPVARAGRRPFVFLFAGGTIDRKGADIAIDAYLRAFSALDDVCLVIKDTCTRTVYRDQNERERILRLAADPSRPAIVYLDDDLSDRRLAGVYTACHCIVQPYRGEGFCLTALEAMACGLPAIVPAGGPTDDFVDGGVGWRVPAERRPMGSRRIGEWDCVGPTWQFEVSVEDLARAMRTAAQDPVGVAWRGEAAAKRVREAWTWRHSAQDALTRLRALGAKGAATPRRGSVARAPSADPRAGRSSGAKAPRSAAVGRRMPTISLCMIARDEERVLGECLRSVRPWVDEIVLVDTGSTDRTVEIAREHGAKVHHFPWIDDFAAARNASIEHATGEWILWMDADDTIPEECGKRLHDVVFQTEERTTGFILQVHFPAAPGDPAMTVVDHVKLFRNLPELRFTGRIHEQILGSINRMGGRVERTDLHVVHSGYDHSPEGQKTKRERDLRILALEQREHPDDPFVWFNVGMTHFHMRDFDRSREALERSLGLAKPHESIVRKMYAMLAGGALEMGDPAKAREWIERGLALTPRDPELLFRAGAVYRVVGELGKAEEAYRLLLTGREVGHIDSLDVTMTGYKARHNLALVLQDMGRLGDAEGEFRAALAEHPEFAPSLLGLGETLLRMGRVSEVGALVERVRPLAPEAAAELERRARSAARPPDGA